MRFTYWTCIQLFCTILVRYGQGVDLQRRVLTDPQAVCNDGSPAVYYTQEALPSPQQNVLIFMQGGGLCTNNDACIDRCTSQPTLCEPLTDPTISRDQGIFNDNLEENPAFFNYYKVFVPYCSSDIYAGNREALDGGNEESLFHFRGYRIIEAVIQDLRVHVNIGEARSVIVTGASAGGMGALVHCDNVAQMLPRATVRCIHDSGTFSPYNLAPGNTDCEGISSPTFDWRGVREYWNGTWPQGCTSAIPLPRQDKDCIMASIAYKYVQTPIAISTFKHDSFYANQWCYPGCQDAERDEFMDQWEDEMTTIAEDLVDNYPHVALYMPSCWGHVLTTEDRTFSETGAGPDGLTFAQVVNNWMQDSGPIHAWDSCDILPLCNTNCGGDNC